MVATQNLLKKRIIKVSVEVINWLIFIAVLWFLFSHILLQGSCLNVVEGNSMEPTLHDSQIIFSGGRNFERGDIVIANIPEGFLNENSAYEGHIVIKRVIGVPNDQITITQEGIRINGNFLVEDYVSKEFYAYTYREDGKNEVTLASDEYFLMGDNRKVSLDSRFFGPVKNTDVLYEQSAKPTREFYFKLVLTIVALGTWCWVHSLIESTIKKRKCLE